MRWSKPVDMPHEVKLSNPLQLRTALVFGVMLSVLFIAGRVIQQSLGDAGIYAMAAVAGLVDVDAISLSLAQAASKNLAFDRGRGIVLAMLVNTATKAVLAAALGGVAMLRSATGILALALLAGASTAFLTLGQESAQTPSAAP
ncbi:MAG: DUF4010 domain-containing protein [Woeseiaceae bacterium]